jgi:hypothetical protein
MKATRKLKGLFAATVNAKVLVLVALACGLAFSSQAATQAPISGEIQSISVNDINDVYSRGTIVVGGQNVIVPANMVIDLPANRLTLQQFYTEAPPECVLTGETGLAKEDACNASSTGATASILANRTNGGNVIAGYIMIEKAAESVLGVVTYIDYNDGYLRVNGDPVDTFNTGTMVRINDPSGRFTVQRNLGIADPNNAVNGSADPRFGVDPDNYTITFSTGYPACIPSTVTGGLRTAGADAVTGVGDEWCPVTNRPGNNNPPDAFRFAPILLGDHIAAEGNFEIVNGVQFLSAHTLTVHTSLTTGVGQPDYIIFDEVEWDVAGFQNERIRTLFIGFSSKGDADVDLFTLNIDPNTGLETETIMASTLGCENAAGGGTCSNQGIPPTSAGIFKLRYDVDFLTGVPIDARNSPCQQLNAANLAAIGLTPPSQCAGGITLGDEFSVISPISRDLIGRSRNKLIGNAGGPFGDSFDITGSASPNGEYLNPVGIGHPEFVEINLNAIQTPLIFAGEPWNLDRRLGPGGCIGGCPGTPQPLTPFPFSGLNPQTQSTLLGAAGQAAADRIFAFVTDPNTNPPTLGGSLAWPPADPAAEQIAATPVVELTCPVVPPGFVEVLRVSRAEYSSTLARLIVVATTNGGAAETMTADWGNGSGELVFWDTLNGRDRYRGIFRNLPAAPSAAEVTVTSSLASLASKVITTVPVP